MESSTTALNKVEIKDVFSALPEIFPGVQQVPLNRIHPNPQNPGAPITEDQIAEMAANLEVTELDNPIKLMPDTENPLGPGISLNPENPRLRGDGRPWEPTDFNWVILAGELRYRAFDRLKRRAIPAYICNPAPQDVPGQIHRDNAVRDRGWWADYQTIEQHIQANPNDTQRLMAAKLNLARPKVTRAIGLLPLLNVDSRSLIGTDSANSNKGILGISELAASELIGLGPGTGLKPGVKGQGAEEAQKLWPYPPIPSETQEMVHRTLAVAIDNKMTQTQVKSLVAFIKGGGQPEAYDPKYPPLKKGVGEGSQGASPVSGGEDSVRGGQGLAVPAGGKPSVGKSSAETEVGSVNKGAGQEASQEESSFGSLLAGGVLAKQFTSRLGVLGPFLNRYLPHLPRLFNWTKGWVHKAGVKNHTAAWLITVFILLWVGTTAIHIATRVVSRVLVHMAYMRLSPPRLARGTNTGSSPVAAIPPPDQDQVNSDRQTALNFARDFYGADSTDTTRWMNDLNGQLAPGYSEAFFKEFCPASKIDEIRSRQLWEEFYSTQPAKVLGADPNGEEVLVVGTAMLKTNINGRNEVLSQGPVSLEVHLTHDPSGDLKGQVDDVREMAPLEWPAAPKPIVENTKLGPKQNASKKGNKKVARASVSSPLPEANQPGLSSSKSPKTIPSWAQDEIPTAGEFAQRFYGISYSNWDDTLAYLKTQVLPDYAPDLVTQYFPEFLKANMEKNQLAEYFSTNQAPRVVNGEGNSAEILVQGTVTTQTRLGRMPQTVSTMRVALLIHFRHAEGIGSKIEKVKVVDPATLSGKDSNSDLGKSLEGTVQDVGHAVNTAKEGTDAVDTAKKLMGF